MVKNLPAEWETGFNPWVGKIPWRNKWLPTPAFLPEEFHPVDGALARRILLVIHGAGGTTLGV